MSQIDTKNGHFKISRGSFFSVLENKSHNLQKQTNLKGENFPFEILEKFEEGPVTNYLSRFPEGVVWKIEIRLGVVRSPDPRQEL